jgi:opacity protein-like surface antigen
MPTPSSVEAPGIRAMVRWVAIRFVLRMRSLTALAMLPLAASAEISGSARVSSGIGIDSNARRDYDQVGDGAQADAFAFVSGWGHFQLTGEKGRTAAEYELGFRKFLQLPSQDVLVQSLTAEGLLLLGRSLGVGLDGRVKDRRGGERDYSDLAAFAFLELAASHALDLRVDAGGRRFIYRPYFPYSFKASEFTAQARYRFDRKHSIALFGELGLRYYDDEARPDPRREPDPNTPQRQDLAYLAGIAYSYRGPIALTLSYSYGGISSNSFGETALRHRLVARVGAPMPWELTLLAQAVVQRTHYPDGVYNSPDLVLLEDDNQNSISLKLLRPLSDHLDAELLFALYHASLPENRLTYLRQVAWIGFTWRL